MPEFEIRTIKGKRFIINDIYKYWKNTWNNWKIKKYYYSIQEFNGFFPEQYGGQIPPRSATKPW